MSEERVKRIISTDPAQPNPSSIMSAPRDKKKTQRNLILIGALIISLAANIVLLIIFISKNEEINALELQEFIERIYLSLPEKVVNTFRMSRHDGLTYSEIAEKLGITTKVVEYHISITLKALRLRLGTSSKNSYAVHPAKK